MAKNVTEIVQVFLSLIKTKMKDCTRQPFRRFFWRKNISVWRKPFNLRKFMFFWRKRLYLLVLFIFWRKTIFGLIIPRRSYPYQLRREGIQNRREGPRTSFRGQYQARRRQAPRHTPIRIRHIHIFS